MEQSKIAKLNGFTLLEVIITLGILASMSSLAIFSVRKTNQDQTVRRAAQQLQSAVYSARDLSMAPRPQKASGVDGYRIVFTNKMPDGSYAGYRIEEIEVLGADGRTIITPAKIVKEETILNSAHFLVTSPQAPVVSSLTFSISQQGAMVNPAPTIGLIKMDMSVANTKTSVPLTISTMTGQVEIGKSRVG